MKRNITLGLLLLILAIVVAASFFASSHPDGLEKVAEDLGFIERGVESQSLMTDYSLPFLSEGPISTALAGVVGTAILLAFFLGLGYILKPARSAAGK